MTQSSSNGSSGSTKKLRGFALLKEKNPERMREIAQLGGWAVQDQGVGHLWTEQEQKAAVQKSLTVRKERALVGESRDRPNSDEGK